VAANFLIAIVVLWLHPRGDRFSLDAILARRGRDTAATAGEAIAYEPAFDHARASDGA
jgi:hypothetical protein